MFKSAGRLIIPDNNKVEFKGGVDGGVRRSTLAWPHHWTFVKAPASGPMERLARPIKTAPYVEKIVPGILLFLIEVDNEWGSEWTSGQILPQPRSVIEVPIVSYLFFF